MEGGGGGGGGGMRQSRSSSRYAPSPSPAVFNGPVRKWKKQWVPTSPSISVNRNAPPLLLCRWTPLSSATADQPPARRFRYAPVVPIEKGTKKAQDKVGNEARTTIKNQLSNDAHMITSDSDGILEKPSNGDTPQEEAEELSEDQADSNESGEHGYPYEKKRKVSSVGEVEVLI